jgi:AsnC-type helix-turn-helix domain
MVPHDLDRLDRGIIAALQIDGRRADSRIADEVGVSESVVRYRVQRLEDAGILRIVGIADPMRIGAWSEGAGRRERHGRQAPLDRRRRGHPVVPRPAGPQDVVRLGCRGDRSHFVAPGPRTRRDAWRPVAGFHAFRRPGRSPECPSHVSVLEETSCNHSSQNPHR